MERLYLVWESAQVKTIEYQIIFPRGWQSSPQTVKFQPFCKVYEDIFKNYKKVTKGSLLMAFEIGYDLEDMLTKMMKETYMLRTVNIDKEK